ncbi:MAG: RNA polymerase sigma-I factor [Firmicutes bacterium HGW-Firmicutes-12]|nr:MAG: RNA polymerase sigma-I factor [Firmicutes bacterium HGW-Firmicutes-12]
MLENEMLQIISEIQQGHEQQREELIKRYLPFILRVASKTCKRFVRLGLDDEVSIALIAFNEALDKYDCTQSTSFFTFAETVIKRRIIDYFRKKQKETKEINWSAMEEEVENKNSYYQLDKLLWEKSQADLFEKESDEMRLSEILEYQKKLSCYGISMNDLVAASPKHQDARRSAFQVAQRIYQNNKYRQYLEKTKTLPLKELEQEVEVSRKTLERQRKYIIALTIILMGEYYYLQEYLRGIRG